MIGIYFKTLKDRKFKQITEYRAGSWINVENAEDSDLIEIGRLTGLEKADLSDSLDTYEVPRIEREEGKNILIFLRNPASTETYLKTEVLTVVVTPKYLITISPAKNAIVDAVLEQSTKIATTQKSKLLIKLLLRIANAYTQEIKQVRNNVHTRLVPVKKVGTKDIIVLSDSEEVLTQYLSALVPMNNVFEAIRTGKFVGLYADDEDLLTDLSIGMQQSQAICEVNLKSITGMRESYQVLFTNNLNKVIKLLTALTIILTIPTITASLFGMNVVLPFAENPLAFYIVMGIAAIVAFVVLLIFYYEDFL